jgi:MYXO-CTERM domain-containing protein
VDYKTIILTVSLSFLTVLAILAASNINFRSAATSDAGVMILAAAVLLMGGLYRRRRS